MKISIITVVYNAEETIRDCIESVQKQDYPDIEHIIIDGASTDGTVRIIKSYGDVVSLLVSEPDEGLYDAMNKGIKLATGDVVGILNADDFYTDNRVLSKVASAFMGSNVDAVYGDLQYVARGDISKKTRFWQAGECEESKLQSGWTIPHPTLFVNKKVYEKLDKLFDTDFKIAADYELILRLLKVEKIKIKYTPETFVCMREGGNSAKSFRQRIRGWKELQRAWRINNFQIPHFFILKRVLGKVLQYFR